MKSFGKKTINFFGGKKFLFLFLSVALPIIFQQVLINSATVIDQLMLGQLESEVLQASAAITAIVFVPTFIGYALSAGSGIYISQYWGANDKDGVRKAFGNKMRTMLLFGIIVALVFGIFSRELISIYTPNEKAIEHGMKYFKWLALGAIPTYLITGLSTSFNQIGLTKKPFYATIVAIIINVTLNWALIFGAGPFPKMGIEGAAIATFIAKTVELIVYLVAFRKNELCKSYISAFFAKDRKISNKIFWVTLPLVANETLWAVGMSTRTAIWSNYGTTVLQAIAVIGVVQLISQSTFSGLAAGSGYIIGTSLGSGDTNDAKKKGIQLIRLSVVMGIIMAVGTIILKGPILWLYSHSTGEDMSNVIGFAENILWIYIAFTTLWSVLAVIFFILRSGGQTKQIFIMDSIHMWLLVVPTIWLVWSFGNQNPEGIYTSYIVTFSLDFIKLLVAIILYRMYKWLNVMSSRDNRVKK